MMSLYGSTGCKGNNDVARGRSTFGKWVDHVGYVRASSTYAKRRVRRPGAVSCRAQSGVLLYYVAGVCAEAEENSGLR